MRLFSKKNLIVVMAGLMAGIAAGLFGAGGGVFAMPLLAKTGLDKPKQHANTVALILAISIPAAIISLLEDPQVWPISRPLLPGIIIGGIGAGLLLKKLPERIISGIFGILLLASAFKAVLR